MSDFIVLILAVPLMAFIGLYSVGAMALIIYRDVLGIDDRVGEWLDRQFGTGLGIGPGSDGLLRRLLLLSLAVVMAFFGYACFRYGVVGPIAEYVF